MASADRISAEIMALKFSLGLIDRLALVEVAIRLFELLAPDVPAVFDRAAEHSVDRCYCGIEESGSAIGWRKLCTI